MIRTVRIEAGRAIYGAFDPLDQPTLSTPSGCLPSRTAAVPKTRGEPAADDCWFPATPVVGGDLLGVG